MVENALFFGRSSGRSKGVPCISGESAGKMAPIMRVITSRKTDFISVIQHGNAAHGEHIRLRHLQTGVSRSRQAHKAGLVVQTHKVDQNFGTGIQPVAGEDFLDRTQIRIIPGERVSQSEVGGIIEDGIYTGIDPVETFSSSLIKSGQGRVAIQNFA